MDAYAFTWMFVDFTFLLRFLTLGKPSKMGSNNTGEFPSKYWQSHW
jgi:hypothetical protein